MLLQLFLFVVFYALAKQLIGKVRNLPPSPFPELPIIGHLYLTMKQPMHKTLVKISNRYGPITLLQFGVRRVLVVSSPTVAEECLSTNDIVFANRPRMLAGKYTGSDYTSLVWASYGSHWRNLRKIATLETLSSHRIHALSDIRADEVRSLIKQLVSTCDGAVNMKTVIFETIFNVMMRMIAGRRYFLEGAAKDEELERLLRDSFNSITTTYAGDYLPFLKWIGYGGMEKRLKRAKAARDSFMENLIEELRKERADGGGKRKTLIQVLLSLQEEEPEYYKDSMIRSLMMSLLAAGTDTSSSTLEWALSLLLNHPKSLHKAQSEIDKVVGFDRLIEENDLGKIHYLNCIITETLRLYPPGPLIPHESSSECYVGGYRVPGGTMLLINLYHIHNDTGNWTDAAEFRPERFEGTETTGGREHGFRTMPFGYGRRGCPGETLATQILGLTLGSLIQCFDWETIDGKPVDMTEGIGLTVPKENPLMVKVKPRAFLASVLG